MTQTQTYTVEVTEYGDGSRGEKWRDHNGELHNPHGPAVQGFYEGGMTERLGFYINGELHNINGPAVQMFYGDGTLQYQEFWIDGKELHNINGPAVQMFYGDGTLQYQEFWIDGKELTKEQFKARTTVKEMTIAEIEKKLGHGVKVVG